MTNFEAMFIVCGLAQLTQQSEPMKRWILAQISDTQEDITEALRMVSFNVEWDARCSDEFEDSENEENFSVTSLEE
jgi:hypothetical protein